MPRSARLITAAILCFALLTQGCTATVYRHHLPPVDGEIASSDADGVNVRIHGRLYRVPAEQIDDIDHPGNVLMVVGAVAAVLGGSFIAGSVSSPPSVRDSFLASGLTYGIGGLVMIIGGGIPWASSRGAAMQYEYGPKHEKAALPIDCAPITGVNSSNCPETPPEETLPPGVR